MPSPRTSSCAVGVRPVGDVEHDDGMGLLIDPVANAPVSTMTGAGGVLPRVLVAQWMTDAAGIVQKRACGELSGCGSDLLGKLCELALCAGPNIKLPATARLVHAAPASWNR